MAAPPLRFIHAADFHLDQPLYGVSEVPSSLAEQFLDAPYTAARRVFDAAIHHQAEFVLLAGDLLNLRIADPRSISFLIEQFERLEAEGIRVYWSTTSQDSGSRWPSGVGLPDGVHRFNTDEIQSIRHPSRTGEEVTILGQGTTDARRLTPAKWNSANDDSIRIAVTRTKADSRSLAQTNISYWALGGSHQRKTRGNDTVKVHHAGSPQGRCPQETGPHGCTLVEIDDRRRVQLQTVDTDAVRWATLKMKLDKQHSMEKLKQAAGDRLLKKMDAANRPTLLVSWQITTPATLQILRERRTVSDGLLQWLRNEFADANPAIWSATADLILADMATESIREEKSILGDFLKIVQQCQADEQLLLPLDQFTPEEMTDRLSAAIDLTDEDQRQDVLREAAALGMGLLRGPRAA